MTRQEVTNMTCNEFEEILPDYLTDSGDPRQRSTVEKHMAECGECRESYAIWKKLAQLPEQVPPARMRTRFETMLNAYEEGRWEHDKLKSQRSAISPKPFFGGWLSMPAMQLAAAAALLVIGIMIGRMEFSQKPNDISAVQLAELTKELHSTKQLVALTLMQQTESASQRLQGVGY